jgi:hypothetical protein
MTSSRQETKRPIVLAQPRHDLLLFGKPSGKRVARRRDADLANARPQGQSQPQQAGHRADVG